MRFIVFEGLDGSGKSSLMSSLQAKLKETGVDFISTREPGGTPLGDEIRKLILSKDGDAPSARTELLLYEASRAQHVDRVIKPALDEKKWILCDRFSASSIAFQAGGRQITEEWVHILNSFATGGLNPELTVLLDLSVEESRRRQKQRQNQTGVQEDRMESEEDAFHQRVRNAFLAQAHSNRDAWLVLDAGSTPTQLFDQLWSHLQKLGWV